MSVIQLFVALPEYVLLRFERSIDVSTFINDNFVLLNSSMATPSSPIADAFDPINVERDYQSLSRELYLYWNVDLAPNTEYAILITGLEAVGGIPLDDEYLFLQTTAEHATPQISESTLTKQPTEIEDWSIKIVTDLSLSPGDGIDNDEDLQVISIHPDVSNSYYLHGDDVQGKIEITFNHFIPYNYLNQNDFKLQKKHISQGSFQQWENVNTVVTQSILSPVVSVYLPSQDVPPVYSYQFADISDFVFWEPGYKYRLIISKNVGY